MEDIISLNILFSSLLKDLLLTNSDHYLSSLSDFSTEIYSKGVLKANTATTDVKSIITEYETTLNNSSNNSKGIITSSEFFSSVLSLLFEVTYSNTQAIFFIENNVKLNANITYYRLSNIMEIDIISSSMEYKSKCNQSEILIGKILNKQLIHISIEDIDKKYQHINSHLKNLCLLIDSKKFPILYKCNI